MYRFYFNNYKEKILLPVSPSKLQLKISNKNTTMNLINEGEVNFLKSPGLTDVSFEVMLPHTKYPFSVYENGYLSIPYFLNYFKELKKNKTPFEFIVSRVSPKGDLLYDNQMKVSLEDYSITDDAKNGFDVMVSINLKEYKDYKTQIFNISNVNGKIQATIETQRYNAPNKTNLKNHIVLEGETLWGICKKYLNDGSKCYDVAKLNNIVDAMLLK